jgi:hypothetical protein
MSESELLQDLVIFILLIEKMAVSLWRRFFYKNKEML